MDPLRRKTLLSLLALPAGCSIQPLGPVRSEPLAGPASTPQIRPPALGQAWTYRKLNAYNSQLVATEIEELSALSPQIVISRKTATGQALPEERHSAWGQQVRDPAWDRVQNYEQALPLWPQSLDIGTRSSAQTHYLLDNFSYRFWINVYTVVQGWEKLHLPAGDFNTLRIERLIRLNHFEHFRQDLVRRDTLWLAPEIGRWAARETSGEYLRPGTHASRIQEDHFRWELTNWT